MLRLRQRDTVPSAVTHSEDMSMCLSSYGENVTDDTRAVTGKRIMWSAVEIPAFPAVSDPPASHFSGLLHEGPLMLAVAKLGDTGGAATVSSGAPARVLCAETQRPPNCVEKMTATRTGLQRAVDV